MASLKWSSEDFLFALGFDVKLHLNPHFLTISRRIRTLSIILVGSEYICKYWLISIISRILSAIKIYN